MRGMVEGTPGAARSGADLPLIRASPPPTFSPKGRRKRGASHWQARHSRSRCGRRGGQGIGAWLADSGASETAPRFLLPLGEKVARGARRMRGRPAPNGWRSAWSSIPLIRAAPPLTFSPGGEKEAMTLC